MLESPPSEASNEGRFLVGIASEAAVAMWKLAAKRDGLKSGLLRIEGTQFAAFCFISKHQEEATSEKGPKTPRGRSEHAMGSDFGCSVGGKALLGSHFVVFCSISRH